MEHIYDMTAESIDAWNPKALWIADAVISVSVGRYGICQIDYHGKQPVSHNAKMMVGSSAEPVLSLEIDGEILDLPQIQYTHWTYTAAGTLKNESHVEKMGFVSGKSFFFGVRVQGAPQPVRLCLRIQKDSLYQRGHGHTVWESLPSDGLLVKNTTRQNLAEWAQQKGCYLVPPREHHFLFDTPWLLDANNLDQLPPVTEAARKSQKMMFDSETFLSICSMQETVKVEDESCMTLSLEIPPSSQQWSNWYYYAVSFGESASEALCEGQKILQNHEQLFREQAARYAVRNRKAPRLIADGHDLMQKYFHYIPGVVESVKQPCYGITRASASSYYWVWGWDNLVTAHELSKWGDLFGQKRIIEFFRQHRYFDLSIPHRFDREMNPLQSRQYGATDCLFLSLVYQYYCDSGDYDYLQEIYPVLTCLFEKLREKADADYLLRGIGVYPDAPAKMGRASGSCVAMENAAYYFAARIIANIAAEVQDTETSACADAEAQKIYSHFDPAFFDACRGAVLDHQDADGSIQNPTYPLYSYIGAYNRLGASLYLRHLPAYAAFIEENLFTPYGIRCMPVWDAFTDTEPVHNSWYLHWDIYAMKLASLYGKRDTAKYYLSLIEKMLQTYGAVQELVGLKGVPVPEKVWPSTGQTFNVNCTTGMYRTLIESVVGLLTDFGNLTFVELQTDLKVGIDGLFAAGKEISVRKTGTGRIIDRILINGQPLDGCLRIPCDQMADTKKVDFVLCYTDTETKPLKVLEINGARLLNCSYTETRICGSISGVGLKQFIVRSSRCPVLKIGKKKYSAITLNSDTRDFYFECHEEGNFEITLEDIL